MVRQRIASLAMSCAQSVGNSLGCEPVVVASDHSLEISMEVPDKSNRAWDSNQYRRGNLFVKGYANPVKPRVVESDDREELDTVDVVEGEPDEEIDTDDEKRLELIPSTRYKEYLNQHLISELVNPREQWTLLIYGMIGLGAINFLGIIITMWATGAF